MRNLIRNVSHNSRCAPLSTVNFAMKPRRPVAASGATVSSAGITSLVVWPTALNYSVIPSEVEEPRGTTLLRGNGIFEFMPVNCVVAQLATSAKSTASSRNLPSQIAARAGRVTLQNIRARPWSVRRMVDQPTLRRQSPPR
jgi:hypothetical protein